MPYDQWLGIFESKSYSLLPDIVEQWETTHRSRGSPGGTWNSHWGIPTSGFDMHLRKKMLWSWLLCYSLSWIWHSPSQDLARYQDTNLWRPLTQNIIKWEKGKYHFILTPAKAPEELSKLLDKFKVNIPHQYLMMYTINMLRACYLDQKA